MLDFLGENRRTYRHREQILQQDAQYFGVNALDAVFTEIDAPKKMKNEKIEEYTKRGDDPYVLEKFTRGQGFYEMRFDYIQPALGGGVPVEDIMLMIKPFKKEWLQKQGIPLDEMKLIWWFMVRYGFDRKKGGVYPSPEKDPIYWKVLENIEKNQINGLIKFE